MTIQRVNGLSWGVGEKLTSAQSNALDLNTTYALDKRNGQTDVLGSVVSLTGTGSIAATGATTRIKATAAGALIRTETGGRFELGDNDYPLLASGHTGRAVSRQVDLYDFLEVSPQDADSAFVRMDYDDALAGIVIAPATDARTRRIGGAVNFQIVYTETQYPGESILFSLNEYLVDGASFDGVDAVLDHELTLHPGLPSRMPRIKVVRFRKGTPTAEEKLHSAVDAFVDPSASVAAYEALHAFNVTFDQNKTIDKATWRYVLVFWNESGTNAQQHLRLQSLKLKMTVTDLRTP